MVCIHIFLPYSLPVANINFIMWPVGRNYNKRYLAVAEAFYSQIPLIVISADRPHDKIDIGDGQTIRQENVYANHILYNANLTEKACTQNDTEIILAIDISLNQKGPVHINAPFEEPLYEVTEELLVNPVMPDIDIPANSNKEYLGHHLPIWNRARKKMVLVGVNNPGEIAMKLLICWPMTHQLLYLPKRHLTFIMSGLPIILIQ